MTAEPPIRRKPTDLSLEADLVAEAAARRWQAENREALLPSNAGGLAH